MSGIRDHQELLERYYSAEMGNISEYSGNITADENDLKDDVRKYASENGLDTDFIREDD